MQEISLAYAGLTHPASEVCVLQRKAHHPPADCRGHVTIEMHENRRHRIYEVLQHPRKKMIQPVLGAGPSVVEMQVQNVHLEL